MRSPTRVEDPIMRILFSLHPNLIFKIIYPLKQRARFPVECHPLICQGHSLTPPVQKANLKFLLQLPDGGTDRRLCYKQFFRRFRNAGQLAGRAEIFQLQQRHRHTSCLLFFLFIPQISTNILLQTTQSSPPAAHRSHKLWPRPGT